MAKTAVVPIAVPPGVVRGATRALTPGRWVDANLVRWRGGNLQPVGGFQRASETVFPSQPRRMLAWEGSSLRHLGFLCDDNLIIETEGNFFDATPEDYQGVDGDETVGGFGTNTYNFWDYGTGRPDTVNPFNTPLNFSLDTWGEDLLAVAYTDGRLLRWSPATPEDKAVAVTGAPPGLRTMVVTDERHVMVGHVNGEARRIAWCSRENINDWNFASTTNTAGFIDIQTPGIITGLSKVREGILVFTTADVWIVRFIGFPFIYGVERIATHAAPISPQAIVPFEGRAVWMAREGFFLYDAGVIRPLPSEVVDFVYSSIDRERVFYRAHGATNGLFPEIWWWYPTQGNEEPNRYVVWNYAENWWTIGEMARTTACPAGLFPEPFAVGTDRFLYKHEDGIDHQGGLVYAETGALSLGEERLMSVVQAQPDTELGASRTRMTFFARNTLEGAETVHGPYTSRPDGYMDVRFTARDVRIRVEAAQPGDWTVGKTRLSVAIRGRR
jgi:hypothetical protein